MSDTPVRTQQPNEGVEVREPPPKEDTSQQCLPKVNGPDVEAQEGRSAANATKEKGSQTPAAEAHPLWDYPRINTFRYAVCNLALFNQGLQDAASGALLPYIGPYYSLDYTVVSLVFLLACVGYAVAALINSPLHSTIGQRGIAVLGPSSRVVAYIALSQHPPYPAVLVFLVFAGFGNGIIDAAWNAYIGDFARANELLGIMHTFYGLGCTVTPLIATALTVNYPGHRWWLYYYIPLAFSLVEVALGFLAFRTETGAEHRRRAEASEAADAAARDESGLPVAAKSSSRTKTALKNRVTWLVALFLFMYVGVEVTLGGWIVSFMLAVRHAQPFPSGLSATGFWLGLTVGRAVLGFVTPMIGVRFAVALYLLAAIGLELLLWLVPNFIASAVAVALLGFAIGPLFPSAIVAATKLLPRHLHVPAIGFAAAIGGAGAAVLPFAVGAIAQAKGVQSLEPFALALLAVLIIIWLALPRFPAEPGN